MQAGESPDTANFPSCGDFDIRIARDGTWFYRGTPIGRLPLVKLFSTVLRPVLAGHAGGARPDRG